MACRLHLEGDDTVVGILMGTHVLSQQRAFDLMSVESRNSNRRLFDVAADVVAEGDLESELQLRHRHLRADETPRGMLRHESPAREIRPS